MAAKDIVIAGAGGSGREIFTLIRDIEAANPGTWRFLGFVAETPPDADILARLGAPYLGPLTDEPTTNIPAGTAVAIGIGDSQRRLITHERLESAGFDLPVLVHPSVHIGPDVEIRAGTTIAANSVITTNVRLGVTVQVNIGCVIAHDCRVGDAVTFAQSVNLAGEVHVGREVTLFTRVAVNPRLTIGERATVGAGAVVIRDVDPDTTVVGVPARPLT